MVEGFAAGRIDNSVTTLIEWGNNREAFGLKVQGMVLGH